MPGKDELRATLLATLQAPLQQFVALLQAPDSEPRLRARRQRAAGRRRLTVAHSAREFARALNSKI